MRNSVTIVADASFCPDTKAAGYGAWIAGDRGKREFSGPIKGAPNSGTAEVMAITNALWNGLKSGLIRQGDSLLIQTDCEHALRVYQQRMTGNSLDDTAFDYLNEKMEQFGLTVKFRHVKGHSVGGSLPARSICQNMCDKRANAAMKKERSRIRLAECKLLVKVNIDKETKKEKIIAIEKARTNVKKASDRVKERSNYVDCFSKSTGLIDSTWGM